MDTLGVKLRKQRLRLGLTLDDLAVRSAISKPYLSLIETGRVANPPSDEKLQRLEQSLGFAAGELVTQAHLHRTPRDVRAVLGKLLNHKSSDEPGALSPVFREFASYAGTAIALSAVSAPNDEAPITSSYVSSESFLSGDSIANLPHPQMVPIPEALGKHAFAARVHGDAMSSKYHDGDIVIFAPALPPRDGDDCFIRFKTGSTAFKRIFFETDGTTPVVRLQPRNEKYRAVVVKTEDLSAVYRAAYRYHRVDEE
jgi:transcriptional regulator with XRE-family HTH domain